MVAKSILLLIFASCAALTQAVTLLQCQAACAAGTVTMEFLCPEFILPPLIAACYSFAIGLSTVGGQIACANWCYWVTTQTLQSVTGQIGHEQLMLSNISEEMAKQLKLLDLNANTIPKTQFPTQGNTAAEVSKRAVDMARLTYSELSGKALDEVNMLQDIKCKIVVTCDLNGCTVGLECGGTF